MNRPTQTQLQENPLTNYQFSGDELRVLKECNSESFFQRSLPLGTGLGVAAYLGIKNGILKPNIKYGAVPKIVVSAVLGYFLGKISYQEKCAQKLMQLPDSRLGEVLRQRKQGGGVIEQNIGVSLALSPFNQQTPDSATDYSLQTRNPNNALNLDIERPNIAGLDDIYRPSLDSLNMTNEPEIPVEPVTPGTSYEELRKRNREEYEKRQRSPFSRPIPESAPVVSRPIRTQQTLSNEQPQKTQTNKYGDSWTE